MTAEGDLICLKIGDKNVNEVPESIDDNEQKTNLKKHRVFDDDKQDEEKGILDKLFD